MPVEERRGRSWRARSTIRAARRADEGGGAGDGARGLQASSIGRQRASRIAGTHLDSRYSIPAPSSRAAGGPPPSASMPYAPLALEACV